MINDTKKPFADPLVRQRLFPEPAEVFGFVPKNLKEALRDGIIVIDTNVLLVPYTTGKASLEQIRSTFDRLTREGRLRIPGQVAREFADNRAEKLKILFQQLSRKRDTNLTRSEYPLLEGVATYSDMVKREGEILAALSEYRKAIGELLNIVAGWHWDDPVSQIYRNLFKAPIVIDPQVEREELLTELKYRQEHQIPPGYKDANNEYSGVGDLLIWRTLLEIGKQESRDLIFVSGDEKSDWRYQSENRALYPRFELLDEYRRASKGKSLLIISFAELLEEFGVPAPIVAEVKQEEAVASLAKVAGRVGRMAWLQDLHRAEQAVRRWLSAEYPKSEIEERALFPDFVVLTENGPEGYEVKYLRSAEPGRRIREAISQIQHYFESSQISVNLVLIVDDALENVSMSRYISHILRATRLSDAVRSIVIGVLTRDGRFQVRNRIRPGENRGSDNLE